MSLIENRLQSNRSDMCDWKTLISLRIQQRNKIQCYCFQDLINSHNRLFDEANSLRMKNLQLSIQLEKLRQEGLDAIKSGDGSPDVRTVTSEQLFMLEQKLLAQQEELTEIHKKRGENAQMIVELNNLLAEKEKIMNSKEDALAESLATIASLNAEIKMYQANNKQLEELYQLLKDEHQALQLTSNKLEEKLRKTQTENMELVDRLKRYKFKDAEKLNEENENFLRKRNAKMQKELEDAAKDMTKGLSPDSFKECIVPNFATSGIPTKTYLHFDAHDGEVNAVKWNPVERLIATGGADRKVKLWDVSKGCVEYKGLFVGSNAGVMSVDFDSTGQLIIAASNDFGCRVWTINDQRLRSAHYGKTYRTNFRTNQLGEYRPEVEHHTHSPTELESVKQVSGVGIPAEEERNRKLFQQFVKTDVSQMLDPTDYLRIFLEFAIPLFNLDAKIKNNPESFMDDTCEFSKDVVQINRIGIQNSLFQRTYKAISNDEGLLRTVENYADKFIGNRKEKDPIRLLFEKIKNIVKFYRNCAEPLSNDYELIERQIFAKGLIDDLNILPRIIQNNLPELHVNPEMHTLTGHCNKVLAAKFLGELSKVVTGSHDRTLKIFDLRSKACIETKFAGSSCNDLVTMDSAGTVIFSGHFDKKIRLWDARADNKPKEIEVQGKVTSLDLSRDFKYLLACVRDDTLRVIDLRTNEILQTCCAEGFKVGCDWTRAVFNVDATFVTCGSVDGNIYIWDVGTGKVEKILKNEHTSAVPAVSWHPFTNHIVSVDRTKKAVVWSDV